MAKRKTKPEYKAVKRKKKISEVNEPAGGYVLARKLTFFNSFEEMEEAKRNRMAQLSKEERMRELRICINIAYGMHGYDPDKLPVKHFIRFC